MVDRKKHLVETRRILRKIAENLPPDALRAHSAIGTGESVLLSDLEEIIGQPKAAARRKRDGGLHAELAEKARKLLDGPERVSPRKIVGMMVREGKSELTEDQLRRVLQAQGVLQKRKRT